MPFVSVALHKGLPEDHANSDEHGDKWAMRRESVRALAGHSIGWPLGANRTWQPCLKGSVLDVPIDRMYVGRDDGGDEVHMERSLIVRAMSSAERRNAKKATSMAVHSIIWSCHCRLSRVLKERRMDGVIGSLTRRS